MAAEVSADLNVIHDEDELRRMWQHTDDFGRKKEIRQRMYKLREQRLKDFYTGDTDTMASRKHTATHTDSVSDQGFMALKSKEIRDSESPTRDIHRRQGDNNYWNTVQQSSYSTQGDEGDLRQTYERSSTGTGHSEDGNTNTKLEADERGFTTSKTTETDNSKTVAGQQQHDAQIATSSHTKTDDGEAYNYSTSKEHQETKSSKTESKDGSSSFSSSKWETSSSSSSKKVISSSSYGKISSNDRKAITSGDDVDFTTSFDQEQDLNTSTTRRANTSQDSKTYQTNEVRYSTEKEVDSNSFIDTEMRNNIRNNLQDVSIEIREDHFGNDSRRDSGSTYTSEVISNVDDYATHKDTSSTRRVPQEEKVDVERSNVVVDQKIMSEIHKLDSYLSTQNTGTNTPVSPGSVMGEVNWTVVSNNEGEFVYRDDKGTTSPGARAAPIKQADNLDLPKECTEGQYVTTYNEHYTNKKISMDVSPTHDAFARSLRQTPPGTPRSLSRQSLDRSSPERKTKSPRSSPDKERRTSVGSYTIEKPSNVRRKTSEVSKQTGTSKDSTLKSKRKFSTTQTKAAAKARASTPGTSPSTSPSRKQKERSDSPSSASDSDASQVTYSKKTTTSTHTRADVVRRNLMDSYDKESPTKDNSKVTNSSSRPSSPEKSPSRKTSEKKTTGILRKDSRTDSKSTVTTTSSVTENKVPDAIAPHVRDKSPEYSSEGSVGKEVRHSQRKSTPDSSPERAAFTPIKQFRTSPEVSSETIQVTATDTEQTAVNQLTKEFIANEALDTQKHFETIHIDVKISKSTPSPDNKDTPNKRPSSPERQSPDRKTSPVQEKSKPHSTEPQKARSPSPVKQRKDKSPTRKESFTRKDSFSRGKSPSQKDEKPRSQSPVKGQTPRKPSLTQRSPSPQKEQPRSVSPTKRVTARKPSLPARSPSPTKTDKSRSPSPSKNETTTTTTTTITRRSSLKKDSAYSAPPSTRRSSRQGTPSPVKDGLNSRSPSPKKESPERRPSSPGKTTSRSPQRSPNKRSRQEVSSPSVSPCSSPERHSERSPVRRSSGPKSPETVRLTRRSSIPRADQSTVVRKTVETKIEIRSKPTSKIPSSTNKTRPGQSPIFRNTRTDSQNSLDRQNTTTRSYSTTIKKTVEKPKEPMKKTPVTKKTVTTTAVISLQKPTVTSQVRQTSSGTVTRATTYKRASSKEITPKKTDAPADKKPMVTTTTKRIASRTNTPKSKTANNLETDRSSVQSSPEPVMPGTVQSEAFIQQLRKDEETIHGFRNETLNIEIVDDLENETRPELYPETEDDDEMEKPDQKAPEEVNVQHISEKTINVDSKRKVASQFVVTIKKPTSATPTKAAAKPVTTRSSSGPVRGAPQTPAKTTPVKTTNNKKPTTNTVQKADSLNLIRTTSDKNVSKNTTQKRQMSKPEMSTTKTTQQTTKVTSNKQVTETGIASRNVTTAKSATIKRVVPTKKTPTRSVSSSSSEDEEENIPSVVTPNRQEQEYIEELEEMRRNEELEYASKLTATTNQENQLLSVIVQHPRSSRESSPDFSNRSQPYCAVSDDGGSNPRYADLISEPEDVEVFDPKDKPRVENYVQNQPRFEQVTDLDEESEAEDLKLNISVADRVSHFLETSKNHTSTPVREELQEPVDSSKNVLKAKNMFENIAKNQKAPPAPGNKPVDILSRPSVFEARRGQTAPKPVCSDTLPRTTSPDQVQRRGSIQTDYEEHDQVETYETNQYEQTHFDVNEETAEKPQSPPPVKKAPEPQLKPEAIAAPATVRTPSPKKEPTTPAKQPEQTPKTDPTSRSVKKEPIPTFDKKRPDTAYKPKPFEKTISATADISSKRSFFERKAQTPTSPVKEAKPHTPAKERKPLTDSIQNKENIRGPSPPRKTSQTTAFIENERKTSRTSPERKVSTPSPTKERKPSLKSESPERRISLTKSVKERRTSFTKEDTTTSQSATFQKKDSFSKVTERKTSPSRESPEKRAPITQKLFPDHKSMPVQEVPSSPVKERKPSIPSQSPERVPQRKASTTSPDRSAKSPERGSPSRETKEQAELNKAGKFGVTLRRTSSTTSAGTPRRQSIPGETQEIEDVTDLSLLEIMMEKAVGYEQRRRIRAQIRIVKKTQDDKPKHTRQKSPTRSPTREYKPNQEPAKKAPMESRKPETRRPSSPTKSYQGVVEQRTTRKTSAETSKSTMERPSSPTKSYQGVVEQRTTRKTSAETSKSTVERPSSPTKSYQGVVEQRTTRKTSAETSKSTVDRPSSPTKSVRRQSPEASKPLTNGYHRPGSPERSPQRKESVPERSPGSFHRSELQSESVRSSKTESVEVTTGEWVLVNNLHVELLPPSLSGYSMSSPSPHAHSLQNLLTVINPSVFTNLLQTFLAFRDILLPLYRFSVDFF